jgi:hypothetical protein
MLVPSGFLPTREARAIHYDQEGRLRSFNISRTGDSGIAETNSLFSTESEAFGAIAPFLKKAKQKDSARRNYVVQPGGATIYFDENGPPPEMVSRTEFPEDKESFGHNTLSATAMVQGGLSFNSGTTGIVVPPNGNG